MPNPLQLSLGVQSNTKKPSSSILSLAGSESVASAVADTSNGKAKVKDPHDDAIAQVKALVMRGLPKQAAYGKYVALMGLKPKINAKELMGYLGGKHGDNGHR